MCGVKRVAINGKESVRYLPMEGVTGGRVCAPVWAAIMLDAPKILTDLDRVASMPLETNENNANDIPTKKNPAGVTIESLPTDTKVDTAPEDAGLDSVAPLEQPDVEGTTPAIPAPGDDPKPVELPQPVMPAAGSVLIRKPEVKPDPEIEVLICSDSNLRANDYCVEVVRQMMPKSKAPKRTCNLHGAQPDERPNSQSLSDMQQRICKWDAVLPASCCEFFWIAGNIQWVDAKDSIARNPHIGRVSCVSR
jgi:hypothetical protein